MEKQAERVREQGKQEAAAPPPDPVEKPGSPVVSRPVRSYRGYIFQAYLIGATLGFAALFILASQFAYFGVDLFIARAIQNFHAGWVTFLMEFVSGLGYNPLSYLFLILIVSLFYVIGLRWESMMLIFAAAGVSVLGGAIKLVVHRARPTPDLVNVFLRLSDYSFPSGHVLLFTAFLGFLVFMIFTLAPRSWARTLGLAFLALLIALVGISRVYLGEHWPSDVLGAYLLGSLWLTLTVYVYRWGKPRFFKNQPLAKEKP